MANCTKYKNPLIRNGTSQSQRFPDALSENFILPDEKQIENLLVYARDLATHIKYYNTNTTPSSEDDWQPFFDSDTAALLALIATQDVDDFKDSIRSLINDIQSGEFESDTSELRKKFGLLFSALFTLTYRINYFYTILPDSTDLKTVIGNLIITKLSGPLNRLLEYYKSAALYYQQAEVTNFEPALIEDDVVDDWVILAYKQIKLSEIIDIIRTNLDEKWIYNTGATPSDFDDYYTNYITEDNSIFNFPSNKVTISDVWGILKHVTSHNLFVSIFWEYFSVYSKIVTNAKDYLLESVNEQDDHEPHYTLYLVFLNLFRYAQNDLNLFTGRHLDFYYKDVLHLDLKASEPNHVYLILELAKGVDEYLVEKGTTFNAGKDSQKNDVIYSSDEDVVLNHASIAELMSFYRAISTDIINSVSQEGLLYASPYAASADGNGAKLTSDSKDWHPFVNKEYTDGSLTVINMPEAKIGFAFASHYLFLKEGDRIITITLGGQNLNQLSEKIFTCFITGEKKWVENNSFSINAKSSGKATITVNVQPGDPAITSYNEKIHQENYNNIDTPVIKFILSNTAGNDQYNDLKDVQIDTISIKVECGVHSASGTNTSTNPTGIKELIISNDIGVVDPSKPFLPFGQNPKKGAGVVIGNQEVFCKKGAKIRLFVSWADIVPDIRNMDYNTVDIFFPTAQMKFLEDGVWTDGDFISLLNSERMKSGKANPGELELFWGANYVMYPDVHLPSSLVVIDDNAIVDYNDDYNPYGISSQRGFLKLQLNADFQYDQYIFALQLYMIGVANKTITDTVKNPPPVQPYIPKIQSVYLTYEAETSSSDSSINFIHLYPFGNHIIENDVTAATPSKLMPQFQHTENNALVHNISEFYLGIQDVLPGQKVSVLFKMLDGSTNPLSAKPDEHVFWSYLSNNKWIDFDKNDIIDDTNQLINTGIISFPFAEDATDDNSLLPGGCYWLKAGIKEMPDEVCRFIDLKTQALQATFEDNNNADDFLLIPLAASTITKLITPDENIKSISQPYTSFGGRYKEDSKSFYTRVSERLRHKNRAITMRDFEELVLEAFPDIYKVKCLNHTWLEYQEPNTVYFNEEAAGHVTVISIPDLQLKNAINPLRPYTSCSKLLEIKEFLLSLSNGNMTLHVENPMFEEVRIETEVVLVKSAAGNDSYYSNLLKEELVEYLTPWANNVNAEIYFGGKITKSSIIDFLEDRSYIDFVLDLKMFLIKTDGSPESEGTEEISASTSASILVSSPVSKHKITISSVS